MAFRYTPTPTPSITPTISLTPSITPTITPSTTTCPYICCWPTTGSTSWTQLITEMKPFADDESFWLWRGGSFNGQTIGNFGARFSPCGVILNTFSGNCVNPFRGGASNAGMYQQSDDKVIIYVNANVSRYNTNYTSDNTFNTIYLPGTGSPNLDLFGGCYVNPSDEIYIMGLFPGDPIFECSGTSYNFNTNIYKIKKDGGIDTSYSGITIGTIPNIGAGEPRLMTSENDPDGKVLIIRFSAFTGNSTWAPIMRMNPNGLPDPTFNNSAFSAITAGGIITTYAQEDGKYMIGGVEGQMLNVGGYANQDIVVRLNNDGSVDTSFVYGGGNYTINDIEQDIEGNYHLVYSVGGPGYGYMKLSNTGSLIFNKSLTSTPSAVMCWKNTVYVSGFQSMRLTSTPNYQTLLKFDLDGNLLMCPFPSPTPTMTPTQTNTPTRPIISPTPTNTSTPTFTPTPSITPPSGELFVYAKYRNAESVLQYQVNYGAYNVIGNIDSLSCQYFYTITGLTAGDVIYLTTYSGCILAYDTSSPCPNSGFACDQTYIFPGGTNYIYITVDGSICC